MRFFSRRRAIAAALLALLVIGVAPSRADVAETTPFSEVFAQLARDLEIGMVVVTHNRSLAARADRALLLEDGRLVDTDVRGVVA